MQTIFSFYHIVTTCNFKRPWLPNYKYEHLIGESLIRGATCSTTPPNLVKFLGNWKHLPREGHRSVTNDNTYGEFWVQKNLEFKKKK